MIDVTEYEIHTNKIQKEYTLALISDLHNEDYSNIVEILKDKAPDFIAVTGDISVRYSKEYETGLAFLKCISALFPTFFSYGNHEISFFTKKQHQEFKNCGAFVLDDQLMEYEEFAVGGLTIRHPFQNFHFLRKFEQESRYKILLCHHTEFYQRCLCDFDIDLILSGHAHGGQIRLPFIGPLFAPGQGVFPKITSGVHFGKLVVSRGLGNPNKLPRWFNNPEIVLIHLKKG